MDLMHRAIALKLSRQAVQCLSVSAVPHVRAMPTLRSRPEQFPFVSVANVLGDSPKQAIRASLNHRVKAFQAQLAPALARRRGQMLVSLWALPLSEGRHSLGGTVSSGSGVGGVQAALRSFTGGDAQPFVQADGFAAA